MNRQARLSRDQLDILTGEKMLGLSVNTNMGPMRITKYLGHGDQGCTYVVETELGAKSVLKLVTPRAYEGTTYLSEVAKLVSIGPHENIANFHDAGTTTIDVGDTHLDMVYLRSELVDGVTLKEFLAKGDLTTEHLEAFVLGICAALERLQEVGIAHCDLHDRNIMITQPSRSLKEPRGTLVKVVDFGSARFVTGPIPDELDDYLRLSNHLATFYNRLRDKDEFLGQQDREFLEGIPSVVELMRDENPHRRLRDAVSIYREVVALRRASQRLPSEPLKLDDPFAFISAEEIQSDRMLLRLFSGKFPWYRDIEGPSAVSLIGPRGCGKTMILRSMRLKTKLAAEAYPEVRGDPYLAFFIPCNTEFRLRFFHLDESTLKRRRKELIHFFNTVLSREVVDSFVLLPDPLRTEFGLNEEFGLHLLELVRANTSNGQNVQYPAHISPLSVARAILQEEVERTYDQIVADQPMNGISNPTFLINLISLLKEQLPRLAHRQIFFLLDDYVVPKMPEAIQEILNVIVWNRNPLFRFKVASAPFGIVRTTELEDFSIEEREYVEINLGTEYMSKEPTQIGAEFLADVVNKRLKLAGYEKTIQDIWGHSSYPHGSLGRSLWKKKTRNKTYYHGFECVVNLCSGDISTMLGLCRAIFAEAERRGLDVQKDAPLPAIAQDKAIREYSRSFLSKVRDIPIYGERLYRIVTAFGTISQKKLYTLKGVSKGKKPDGTLRVEPYQLLRIEVTEDARLDPECEVLFRALQKWDVFIDADVGRSRRLTLSRKVLLRKILCPAFKTTLTNSECMLLDGEKLKFLFFKPHEFTNYYLQLSEDQLELPEV